MCWRLAAATWSGARVEGHGAGGAIQNNERTIRDGREGVRQAGNRGQAQRPGENGRVRIDAACAGDETPDVREVELRRVRGGEVGGDEDHVGVEPPDRGCGAAIEQELQPVGDIAEVGRAGDEGVIAGLLHDADKGLAGLRESVGGGAGFGDQRAGVSDEFRIAEKGEVDVEYLCLGGAEAFAGLVADHAQVEGRLKERLGEAGPFLLWGAGRTGGAGGIHGLEDDGVADGDAGRGGQSGKREGRSVGHAEGTTGVWAMTRR
jgi:hypothetical protein